MCVDVTTCARVHVCTCACVHVCMCACVHDEFTFADIEQGNHLSKACPWHTPVSTAYPGQIPALIWFKMQSALPCSESTYHAYKTVTIAEKRTDLSTPTVTQ
eukprot:scpid104938/ scgid3066/ 